MINDPIESLLDKNEKLEKKISELKNEIDQLKANSINEDKESSYVESSNELDQKNEEKTCLLAEIDRLNDSKTQLMAEIGQSKEEKDQILTEISQLKENKSKLLAEIDGLKEDRSELAEIDQLNDMIEKLKPQDENNDNLKDENKQLMDQIEQLKAQISQLKTDNTQLSIEIDQLKEDKEQSIQEVNQSEEEQNQKKSESNQEDLSKASDATNDKEEILLDHATATEAPTRGDINVIFFGNAKTGKSTALGHLIYNSFSEDQKSQIEKNVLNYPNSNVYSYVSSSSIEEVSKGKTIDLSYRSDKSLFRHNVTLIDSPGNHSSYKKTINGVFQSDAAVIFIDPMRLNYNQESQPDNYILELFNIASSACIKQVIVAVNKMDDESVKYSEYRFIEVKQEISKILGSIDFQFDKITFIPISGLIGDNLTEKSSNMPWWYGPTLSEAINNLQEPVRQIDSPLRFLVYQIKEIGEKEVKVLGRVEYGVIKKGQTIIIESSKKQPTVEEIIYYGEQLTEAAAGKCVVIILKIRPSKINVGDVIGDPNNDPPSQSQNFKVQFKVYNDIGWCKPGYKPFIYCHGVRVQFEFVEFVQCTRKGSIMYNPRSIIKDDLVVVVIRPLLPLVAEDYKKFFKLGVFALGDKSKTFARGEIIELTKKKRK